MVIDGNPLAAGAGQQDLPLGGGETLPRAVEIHLEPLRHPPNHRRLPAFLLGEPAPKRYRALVDAQARIGDHEVLVHLAAGAEAVALLAHALGAVEGEELRRKLGESDAAARAAVLFGEDPVPGLPFDRRDHDAVPLAKRGLDRIGNPPPPFLADRLLSGQPVHHDLDVVLLSLLEGLDFLDELDLPVNPRPGEAAAQDGLQGGAELAPAVFEHRREEQKPGARREIREFLDDLLGGLRAYRPAASRTVGDPDPGEEHPQVVGNLRDGPDRGAGIVAGRLLIDRDCRREPLDRVVEGLVHLPEELAGVAGQRFDVATLTFGVEGVERQGRLSRPRDPAQNDEALLRNTNGNVLEIVLPGAPHHDAVGLHGRFRESKGNGTSEPPASLP